MMRVSVLVLLPLLAQAAPVVKAAPLTAKATGKTVQLSADQQKHMHSGCVSACRPSPVESKCVTACEVAMHKCIDETGPNETPKDTDACQAKALKLYTETKGVEKKEEKKEEKGKDAKKSEKKEEKKKAKSFLQVRNIDDDNAEAAEMARLEAQSDKDMGEDDDETSKTDDSSEDGDNEEESFVQVKRNIDDDNAEAAEMARLEAQSDKDMGEDDDETSKTDDSSEDSDNEEESFVQVKRNIDDDNAEAAEMARLEAQSDKDMGEDDDETSKTDDSSEDGDEEESFVQVKRNIDDDNAEAAEMARLEAQSDKDMGEDDDETSKTDDSSDDNEDES